MKRFLVVPLVVLVMMGCGGLGASQPPKSSEAAVATPGSVATNDPFSGGSTSTPGMLGRGVYITPSTTGRLFVTISGTASNSSAGSEVRTSIQYGTGDKPLSGTVMSGITSGDFRVAGSIVAFAQVGFSRTTIITGLQVGTRYWIDLCFGPFRGGEATIRDGVDIVVIEL
jgi:hypothetical protein